MYFQYVHDDNSRQPYICGVSSIYLTNSQGIPRVLHVRTSKIIECKPMYHLAACSQTFALTKSARKSKAGKQITFILDEACKISSQYTIVAIKRQFYLDQLINIKTRKQPVNLHAYGVVFTLSLSVGLSFSSLYIRSPTLQSDTLFDSLRCAFDLNRSFCYNAVEQVNIQIQRRRNTFLSMGAGVRLSMGVGGHDPHEKV